MVPLRSYVDIGRAMRNTSGDKVQFNYWDDWKGKKDLFALTSSVVKQEEKSEVKHMSSLFPVDGERLESWIRRTARDSLELTENARYHHIHGTKSTWACHTSSRYCIICVACDYVDILRCMALSYMELDLKTPPIWELSLDEVGVTRFKVVFGT